MSINALIDSLPTKLGALLTLEKGRPARYSYKAMYVDVQSAERKLLEWGVTPGARVGIFAPNSYWWLVYDLALIHLAAVSVPFTEDFREGITDSLLDHYNISLLLISKAERRSFSSIPPHFAFLDGDNESVKAIKRPFNTDEDLSDQLSLVFSSGSAGGLKGLVISRKGTIASLPPILDAIGCRKGDRFLLFLSLASFQQRFLFYGALLYDFDIVLADVTSIFVAAKHLNPTIFLAPPILYQMACAEFQNDDRNKSWKRRAIATVIPFLPGRKLRQMFCQKAFPEFYAQFGNSVRIAITGMAPLQKEVLRIFSRLQIPISESYGMVESGVIAYRAAGVGMIGSVGKPLRGVTIRFTSEREIVVQRQDPVTLRYFQCAEGENERTFIGADCIATGDIGYLDRQGFLYVSGRRKEVIVMPSGYKIHPEVIESELNASPDVTSSVVFLHPITTRLTSVIVPTGENTVEVRARIRAHAATLKSTRDTGRHLGIIFADQPFTTQNGHLRPNLKLDRRKIVDFYAHATNTES